MPSIVAGHLGLKGVVVSQGEEKDGNGNKKIKEFEKAPRGGLGTFARLDSGSVWLRERNELLKGFGLDGKTRILICENGVCRDEGTASDEAGLVKEQPLEDLSGVAAALPVVEEGTTVLEK